MFFKKNKYLMLIILSAVFFFGTVFSVSAAIVTCGPGTGNECDSWCDLFQLGNSIINFLIVNLMPPLATVFIAYGAIIMLLSAGNEQRIKSGRKILTNVVIGIAIALSGFLIIKTIMGFLGAGVIGTGGGIKSFNLQYWYKGPSCK